MASILAIVSKKIFDRDFRVDGSPAGLGDVVPTTTYASAHVSLEKLASGGDMFLVTVAPGEQLWLAGVLASPKFAKDRWVAAPCTTPITDITPLIGKLAFENGKGLTARPGALAMSLQTPRTLSDADVELLRAATGGKAAPAKQSIARTPVKAPSPAPKRATQSVAKPAPAAKAAAKTIVPKGTHHAARAQEYLDGGALVEALDELLKAWAQHKAAELAELIDALGAHVARALPAIETKKSVIDAAWRDVGDLVRPADVPRLLAAFEHGSSGQIEGWLDVLDRFPPDPRMCAVAIDTSMRFVASSAGRTRTRACRLAEKLADGRCLPQIDHLIAKRTDAWNEKDLRERMRKMKTRFAPPPALAPGDKPVVAALGEAIAKLAKGPAPDPQSLFRARPQAEDDGSRLLAEVLADPDSDAPRLVYADWLQQHDDLRGELIALQLQAERTPAQDERIAKLLKAHAKSWLGPLAAVVRDPVFERGFLSECTVELATTKHREELLLHPLWATLKKVTCQERVVVESPAMRSLRVVRGLEIADCAALSRRTHPLAIEAIDGLRIDFVDGDTGPQARADWKTLYQVGAFAKLHELGVSLEWDTIDAEGVTFEAWKWLVGGTLGKQLTNLSVFVGDDTPRVDDWLAAFESKSLSKLALVCSHHNYGTADTVLTAVVRRDGKRFAVALELARPFSGKDDVRWELEKVPPVLFAGFPLKAAPQLDVVVTTQRTQQQLAMLEQHFAEQLGGRFEKITVS